MQKMALGAAQMRLVSFSVPQGDLPDGLTSALKECNVHAPLKDVVRQAFFLATDTDRDLVGRCVTDVYGGAVPPTTIVYEPPADGAALAAEIWAFGDGATVSRANGVSTAAAGALRWGFVGGIETDDSADPFPGVGKALKEADTRLNQADFAFSQIVRTWYFIGSLLAPLEDGTRYDRFNQARNEFFQEIWRDLRYSPASTGIGMQTGHVGFEAIVLRGAPGSFKVTWIDNPLQTKPFSYDIQVDQKRKPSFSRAAAVTTRESMVVFISGTASIRKSEVLEGDDVAAQTRITIENIATLIGADNLKGSYGLPRGVEIGDINQYRVYIKRPWDLAAVKAICENALPDVPRVYLVADVCRPQCLVEIEAIAACGR